MKNLIVLLLTMISFTSFAGVKAGASLECILAVRDEVGYSDLKAAKVCSNGATLECIVAVRDEVGYSDKKAAEVCGTATLECITTVRDEVGYSDKKAALACSGQE